MLSIRAQNLTMLNNDLQTNFKGMDAALLLGGPNFFKLWTDPITMASALKICLCCFVSPLLLWFRFL